MREGPMKVGSGIGLKLSRESGIRVSRTELREESPASDSRKPGSSEGSVERGRESVALEGSSEVGESVWGCSVFLAIRSTPGGGGLGSGTQGEEVDWLVFGSVDKTSE